MAHAQQIEFCTSVKKKLPRFFSNRIVLDIGSLDINGNNQYLFDNCLYLGIDLLPGKNVDLVSKGHELALPNESIDVIISTECFEHDQFYDSTIKNIIRMLKPGGLFIFSCATTGRPEHGTRITTPENAPLIQEFGDWGDYYKNLQESDIRDIVDIEATFKQHAFSENQESCDLYFWGIKNGHFIERHDYSFQIQQPMLTDSPTKMIPELLKSIQQKTEQNAELSRLLLEYDSTSIKEITRELALIKSSISWRITKPLRFVRKICRKQFLREVFYKIRRLCVRCVRCLIPIGYRAHDGTGFICKTSNSIDFIVSERCKVTKERLTSDPLTAPLLQDPPAIDISVVTHNSSQWIPEFIDSLLHINYPSSKISVYFVDNDSTDDTVALLNRAISRLQGVGFTVLLKQAPNKGFGAGHNIGVGLGKSQFCLVTNVDIAFDKEALIKVVSIACNDVATTAVWELRQKPYEHPKFYDPVTGLTNWNSHACVLIRRSAFEEVGGYDEEIFMYGEDVDLSYRFRRAGFVLRYCPSSVIYHYAYEDLGKVKSLQYIGSIFANIYLRLKYGTISQILVIPMMLLRVLLSNPAFKTARHELISCIRRLFVIAPKTLWNRPCNKIRFSFYGWDYDLTRYGSFVECKPTPIDTPTVSVITRTYQGRELFLKQALLSVAHQTYQAIEHIVVQDGGDSMHTIVNEVAKVTGRNIRFVGVAKSGRSAVGNIGLSNASGKWCLFLDDDDLLFSDHIEALVQSLLDNSHASAAYSLALDVMTDVDITSRGVAQDYKEMIFKLHDSMKQQFSLEILRKYNYLPIQSVLFNSALFQERGGFDEDMDALEDWVLWNRYAEGNVFSYVAKCTSMFRTPYKRTQANKRHNAFIDASDTAKSRIAQIHGSISQDESDIKMIFPIGHFYSPIVNSKDVKNRADSIWKSRDTMDGIDMNIDQQISLLGRFKPYLKTINYPITQPSDSETTYFYNNDQYPALDAEFLYGAIQYFKPLSVIEVGSGFSSLIIADVNRRLFNNTIEFTCIEPYPRQFLRDGVEGITKLLIQKVEDIEVTLFDCLSTNDILFIDSSHVSKTGSDVNYLFFEVLPTLKPGVIVHIHDIFLPDEYPKTWVIDEGRNWNEQYLLRAFLQYNADWEVLWSAHFMGTKHTNTVQDVFPNYPKLGGGGSFWIRRKV